MDNGHRPWGGLLCISVAGVAVALSVSEGLGRLVAVGIVCALTVLAWAVVARAPRPWAGFAELLAAVVGMAVGATRGVRFIGADQSDIVAWIALAGLQAGLALLVLGTWNLLAGTRGWWRLPAALSVLIGVPLALYLVAIPAVSAIAPRPVLLIAAGAVPDEHYATAYIASGSPVTTWVVPGSAHIGGLSTQPARWTKTVLSFFDENLCAGVGIPRPWCGPLHRCRSQGQRQRPIRSAVRWASCSSMGFVQFDGVQRATNPTQLHERHRTPRFRYGRTPTDSWTIRFTKGTVL